MEMERIKQLDHIRQMSVIKLKQINIMKIFHIVCTQI